MESPYLLEMKGVSKAFPGVQALSQVTLKVKPGTVHALMGENGAGKSTLMKCLFGMYHPDEGTIRIEGKDVDIPNSKAALQHGISMIHQELNPVPHRPVMENIWLGRFPMRGILVDEKRMYTDTLSLFKDLNLDIDPKAQAGTLSVSKIQSMEIAKAVSFNSKVIVMDEPTSSLTGKEVDQLFAIINELRSRGVSIIYISHKMEEILTISDEVTIMRDGFVVGTWDAADLTTDLIITRMVGRDLDERFPERTNVPGEVILKAEGLTSNQSKSFRDVSFELRKGEVLGIGGLVGAQRTELIESLFGLRGLASGTISIHGRKVKINSPQQRSVITLRCSRRNEGLQGYSRCCRCMRTQSLPVWGATEIVWVCWTRRRAGKRHGNRRRSLEPKRLQLTR